MLFTEQDITIYQQATEPIGIVVQDRYGNPIDLDTLEDYCWILGLREIEVLRYTKGDAVISLATTHGPRDTLVITLPPDITSTLGEGVTYKHQAWGTIGGRARPLCDGRVYVESGYGC